MMRRGSSARACAALLLLFAASALGQTSIPVLGYDQINNAASFYSVNASVFAAQMDVLVAQGYKTISPQEYANWTLRGNTTGLPAKPVLITFDDNILNANAATPILTARSLRAVMHVVTGFADFPDGWNMNWAQLTTLKAQGWHIQLHAGPQGHLLIQGQTCTAYYACLLPNETQTAYQTRVAKDINDGAAALMSRGLLSGPSVLFAVPWDDRGQTNSNTAVGSWFSSHLASRFTAVFHQTWGYAPGSNRRYRFEIHDDTTLAQFTSGLGDTRFARGTAPTPVTTTTAAITRPPASTTTTRAASTKATTTKAPVTTRAASTKATTTKAPVPFAAVPVLGYHQVNNPASYLSVNSSAFSAQLALLAAQGYRTISPQQYVNWLNGNNAGLPAKPVLITFDDNVLNANAATPILRSYNFNATMFVVSGFANAPGGWNMNWTQLTTLKAQGWHIQLHAGPQGHALVANQTCTAFYACLLRKESASAYQARVAKDINDGAAALVSRGLLSGPSVTFAVPWDDRGQTSTNTAVNPWLSSYLASRFSAVFHQTWGYAAGQKRRYRFEVRISTNITQFSAALADARFKRV